MPEIRMRPSKEMKHVMDVLHGGTAGEKSELFSSREAGERSALAAALTSPGVQRTLLNLEGRRKALRLMSELGVELKVNPEGY